MYGHALIDGRVLLLRPPRRKSTAVSTSPASAHCAGCHTVRGGDAFAGVAWSIHRSVQCTRAITPDRATGIGRLVRRRVYRALRHWTLARRPASLPAFPIQISRRSPAKIRTRSMPAHPPREPVAPINTAHTLKFHTTVRSALATWRLLTSKPADQESDDETARPTPPGISGAYLVWGSARAPTPRTRNALARRWRARLTAR